MKRFLPIFLIVAGLAIAAITFYGNKTVNKKTDAEYITEGLLEQQAAQQAAAEEAAALATKKLPAPDNCEGLTTGFIYEICETEPYGEEDWPDWRLIANDAEQACVLSTFHQTNKHAAAINGETYDSADPNGNRVGLFLSDVCSASLFTDGIDYGDTDASASALISGFYAERSESRFKPGMDY